MKINNEEEKQFKDVVIDVAYNGEYLSLLTDLKTML